MIRSILVPVDGSAHAIKAVEMAAELGQKCGAKLYLAHVLTDLGSGRVPEELRHLARIEHLDITDTELLKGVGAGILDDAQNKAIKAGCRPAEAILDAGDPAARIVALARERGVDLIVMGRRGLGDLKGLLLGSVTHKVSQMADCACLTVR